MKIKVGIIGGTGYTAGELLRILQYHPHTQLVYVYSQTHAGKPYSQIHTDLIGELQGTFTQTHQPVDVLFLTLPHNQSTRFLAETPLPSSTKIIDLGNDFRLGATYNQQPFIYGLPELNKAQISQAQYIANPGCFATALQLALLPLIQQSLLTESYSTGITGATGAGKSLSETAHFPWRQNNISAYKTLTHQHLQEISYNLQPLSSSQFSIQFVPWRGNFARGIFVSSTVKTTLTLEQLYQLYENTYQQAAFTIVSRDPIHLKQVVGTNKALLHIEKQGEFAVIHSAIDNLLKGASGQAVQNLNLLYQLPENTGLQLKTIAF